MAMSNSSLALQLAAILGVCTFGDASYAQPALAPAPRVSLDELVREYKRFGLPVPPPNARLVQFRSSELALPELAIEFPDSDSKRPRYLLGPWFSDDLYERFQKEIIVEPIQPDARAMKGAESRFCTDYLFLAAQCRLLGWNELAEALYASARNGITSARVRPPLHRGLGFFYTVDDGYWRHWDEDATKRSVASEFRHAAREYWTSNLGTPNGDRKKSLSFLRVIGEDQKLVKAIEQTLLPGNSKPGSVEALIDDFLEFRGWEWDSGRGQIAYRKLIDLGFDAVPALLEHISDPRLTRHNFGFRPYQRSGIITVGTHAHWLLNGLAGRDLETPAEIAAWWAEARKAGEERWLTEHAIPVRDPGEPTPYPSRAIIRVLAVKYPQRLADAYRTILRKRSDVNAERLVLEIATARLPLATKIRLFGEGLLHPQEDQRENALHGIAQMAFQVLGLVPGPN